MKLAPHLARQFLTTIYGPFFSESQGAAFLEVRGKKEDGPMSFRKFYRTPEALLADMPKWEPARNYWIGVSLRRDNQGGTKQNLLALTVLFCDVDCGAAGHKKTPGHKDKGEALVAIEAFHLRPTMMIDSGGGYQPYWLLKTPVGLSNGNFSQVEGSNRGLALALAGDVAATDAARILRLPGTYNLKLAGNPRPVKIVWCEPERVYDLSDFSTYEAQEKAPAQEAPRETGRGRGL